MSKTPSQLVFVPSMAISQHDRIAVFPCFESPVVSYTKWASQQCVGRHVFDIVFVGVKGGGKVGHVGGSIVGLRRWKTVPPAVFYKVDYQPLRDSSLELDVLVCWLGDFQCPETVGGLGSGEPSIRYGVGSVVSIVDPFHY